MQYEEACSGQVEDTLRQKGYAVAYSRVTLTETYEIERITIGIEKSGDNIEKTVPSMFRILKYRQLR